MPVLTPHDRRYLAMSWALGQLQRRLEVVQAHLDEDGTLLPEDAHEAMGEALILVTATTSELWSLREASMAARTADR